MAESFGRLLHRYRVAAGLSQEDLAGLAGVSTNAISALERGVRHAPHNATLYLLIEALRVDDAARLEIEGAARLARARRIQAHRLDLEPNLQNEDPLNNLPPRLTSFVDREKEVAELKDLLQSYRLVTLVGAGGVGKTRCAMKIAADMLGEFPDGVWVVDLTAISDSVLVSTVIARALKVREAPNRQLLETLLTYLERKHLLLIFDNCEHVIDEACRVVASVLRNCPEVRLLATSRESLSIAGERAYRMPSLPVPSISERLSANEMSQYGAVQLFGDRALSADNRFTLTSENVPYVADVCRRLDGIPLAIEMAAVRVAVLSPKQLALKLDERLRVLVADDRNALPRHRTMRALIDWSYDLLSGNERELFRKLSIFAGGFTLETAAAVCAKDEMDEITIVDLLSALVSKSLVQVDIVGDDTRYRFLESTRQYAREKLRDAGGEETTAHAHARAFLSLAEQLFDAWEITPERVWNAQAEPELQNFRSALSWAFGPGGDVLLGQRLAGLLRRVWAFLGPAEGWRWVQVARQRATPDTPRAILAMFDLAEAGLALALQQQFNVGLAAAERALARYRELGDQHGIALAEGQIGTALIFLGKTAEGQRLLERALSGLQVLGNRRSVIIALQFLASARFLAGDPAGARQRFGEALAAARADGAERQAANAALGLAEVEFRGANAVAAVQFVDEALPVLRLFRDTINVARAGSNMAAYLVASRRFDEARAAAREAATAARDSGFPAGLAWTLQHLAAVAALRSHSDAPIIEDRRRAARILGYLEAQLSALQLLRQYTEQQEYNAIVSALRDALGEDELSRLTAEGRTWSEDQAVAEAMLI